MHMMRHFLETMNTFFFPFSYMSRPEFAVSSNLYHWDRMLRNLS
jgi:hypothetical protein